MFLGSRFSSFYNMYQLYLLDITIGFLLSVLVFVVGLLLLVVFNKVYVKYYDISFKSWEFVLSVVPVMVLVCMGVASFHLLFYSGLVVNGGSFGDSFFGPVLDVKVVGHQWYWFYEYVGLGSWMKFDSYMLGIEALSLGDLRLLEVDNRLVLPVFFYSRINISSSDVIHSWFLPSYGFKLDALPGIVNVHLMRFDNVGVFYGMCSEVCGAGHSYMPVVVEVVPSNVFLDWLEDYKHKYDIATRLGDWYKVHGVSSF